MELKGKF
jgi:hypothetical protein